MSKNPLGVMTDYRSHGSSVWSVSTYIGCAEIAAVAVRQWLTCDALLNSLFQGKVKRELVEQKHKYLPLS